MSRRTVLTRVIAKKSLTLSRRYLLNTIVDFLTMYIFFLFLYFGGQFFAGSLLEQTRGLLIIGYFLFTMATAAYSGLTYDLIEEAQWGTLEQLTMSPVGFIQVVSIKSGVNLVGTFVQGSILLGLMIITTNVSFSINIIAIIPLTFLTLLSVVGLGFIFGGMALLYKQIEKIFPLMQLVFLGLVVVPVEQTFLLKLLPISLGSYLLRQTMTKGISLWNLPVTDLLLLVGKTVVLLGVGIMVFKLAANEARKRGELGHY